MMIENKKVAQIEQGDPITLDESANSSNNISNTNNNTQINKNQEHKQENNDADKELGLKVYLRFKEAYEEYVVLPKGASVAAALWSIFTYGYDVFEFAPRLAILSPEPRCGKSTLLSLLGGLVYNPLNASNATGAAIYRAIDRGKLTLLLDEVDTFINNPGNNQMVGILNAGHRKNGFVLRTDSKDYSKIQKIKCYSPVALAGIGNIPHTLQDRSIVISLRRKRPEEKSKILRIAKFESEMVTDKANCQKFMSRNKIKISEICIPTQPFLSDRGNDNWECLFKIAKFISEEVYQEAIQASISLSKGDFGNEESNRCILLRDIKQIFEDRNVDIMEVQELVIRLCELPESPWETYENRGLTPYSLARLLKFFGIQSHQIKKQGINKKRYRQKDFEDAFLRYLPQNDQDTTEEDDENLPHKP